MSGDQLDVALQVALDGIAAPARRSTRKRSSIESYTDLSSNSTGDFSKPEIPSNKRLKKIPTSDSTMPDKKPKSVSFPAKPAQLHKASKDTDYENNEGTKLQVPAKGISKKKQKPQPGEEKRLKRFREKMPLSYENTILRANTQRMFVVDRTRHHNEDCPYRTPDCPMERLDLAGTTGNIYTVTIRHVPSCNCPNFLNGNPQCKHILYVLMRVLKAPQHLMYQAAFLTSELREIFDNAGPLPTESVSEEDKDGKRKPVEGDCPICCEELSTDAGEPTVWCKAACGNNLHKSCFDQWAATKGAGGGVTCPYCRTKWECDVDGQMLKDVKKSGVVGRAGYVNVAPQLGLTGKRDHSTYHSFWVRRQRRDGLIDDDEAGEYYYNY